MECMAIGGPSGNNPLANLFIKNNSTTGVAQNNQTDQVSSTETETKIDSASKLAGRITQLRTETLGDVFVKVDPNKLIIAGDLDVASPLSSINFNQNTGISALGEPSSVTAINNPVFGEIATSENSATTLGNQQLLLATKTSQTVGISGDFQVSEESANLKKDNELLALVGNA